MVDAAAPSTIVINTSRGKWYWIAGGVVLLIALLVGTFFGCKWYFQRETFKVQAEFDSFRAGLATETVKSSEGQREVENKDVDDRKLALAQAIKERDAALAAVGRTSTAFDRVRTEYANYLREHATRALAAATSGSQTEPAADVVSADVLGRLGARIQGLSELADRWHREGSACVAIHDAEVANRATPAK